MLAQQGMMVKTGSAEQLAERVSADIVRYKELAKTIVLEVQ